MSEAAVAFHHIHIISEEPSSAASWYVEMLGGKITSVSEIRDAPQIAVAFEGAIILIRGKRPGEQPSTQKQLESFTDYVSHNQWGTDHFGFTVDGDFDKFCNTLKQKGATFSVEPHDFRPGTRIAYLQAPDGVSVELIQA
jgi:catechol 2,3-dioxygenase-like lactoylglutathione lyase family enzyme